MYLSTNDLRFNSCILHTFIPLCAEMEAGSRGSPLYRYRYLAGGYGFASLFKFDYLLSLVLYNATKTMEKHNPELETMLRLSSCSSKSACVCFDRLQPVMFIYAYYKYTSIRLCLTSTPPHTHTRTQQWDWSHWSVHHPCSTGATQD